MSITNERRPLPRTSDSRFETTDGSQACDQPEYGSTWLPKDVNSLDCFDTVLRTQGDEHSDIVESNELPPDGGYGWVVVFAAFMSNFIVDGICNSFGAFITTYQQYFGQSKALVTLVGSLLIGCYQLIGPFAGGLVKNYGVRPVVISGSLLASASFAASIYSPNIYLFMISYGLFGGAGFGLIYLPAIVSVSFYFNRKRSIATGITVAGSGAGTFVLPPVCMYLLKTLGWKITVCALAAVALSCTALGALYKPLAPAGLKKDQNGKSPPKLATCKLHRASKNPSERSDIHKRDKLGIHHYSATENAPGDGLIEVKGLTVSVPTNVLLIKAKRNGNNWPHFMKTSPSPSSQITNEGRNSLDLPRELNESDHYVLCPSRKSIAVRSMTSVKSDFNWENKRAFIGNANQPDRNTAKSKIDGTVEMKPTSKQDSFCDDLICSFLEFKREGGKYCRDMESRSSILASTSVSRQNLPEYDDRSQDQWIPASIRNTLNEMIDVDLLKEPVMLLLCISNLLGMLGFYVPFMFLINMAVRKGMPTEDASLLLSLIGITNTLGRIVIGWLADRRWVSALSTSNMSLILCGLLTCLCPLPSNRAFLIVYATLFGFIISAYICLTSIVLTDLLGLDRLTNSFGLVVVSRGIASLLGPPIAGMVYDATSTYSAPFYFAGSLMALAGIVSCAISHLRREQNRKIDVRNKPRELVVPKTSEFRPNVICDARESPEIIKDSQQCGNIRMTDGKVRT